MLTRPSDPRPTRRSMQPSNDEPKGARLGTHIAKVLVAEDDREMRRLVADVLRKVGYRVYEVGDGSALIGLLDDIRAGRGPEMDLLVMDVRMPGCTGLEVLGALRTVDWLTPVIVMTAFGSESVHQEAQHLGAAIVLDKPFSLSELRHAARSLVPPRY